jgi:DNA-binding transcriptional ArsR family regulator
MICYSFYLYTFAYEKRMKPSENIATLAFVKRGRQRTLALKQLPVGKPVLVSELQRSINQEIKATSEGKEIRLSDVSRTLKTLLDAGLVVCLNPRQRPGEKGILYQLTEEGEKIKSML